MASAATLSSTTIENQVVELMSKIQAIESNPENNPDNNNRITGTFNQDTGIYSGTFNIPCSVVITAEGAPSFVAKEYLTNPA